MKKYLNAQISANDSNISKLHSTRISIFDFWARGALNIENYPFQQIL
jgi:hypothetical protein